MKEKLRRGKRSRSAARTERRAARVGAEPRAEVTVTFRHVEPTAALREYAQRKLAHIARYTRRPCQVRLILTVDKYRQCGEVTVKSGRLAVTAQEQTKDLYAVIDLLEANIERQLKKHLEKIDAKRVRARSTGEILSAAETQDLQSGPDRQ
jgi:putative sigma-54 modulation protein